MFWLKEGAGRPGAPRGHTWSFEEQSWGTSRYKGIRSSTSCTGVGQVVSHFGARGLLCRRAFRRDWCMVASSLSPACSLTQFAGARGGRGREVSQNFSFWLPVLSSQLLLFWISQRRDSACSLTPSPVSESCWAAVTKCHSAVAWGPGTRKCGLSVYIPASRLFWTVLKAGILWSGCKHDWVWTRPSPRLQTTHSLLLICPYRVERVRKLSGVPFIRARVYTLRIQNVEKCESVVLTTWV